MDEAIRNDPVKIAAWLEQVRNANIDETGPINTRTAEEAPNGIDISQLRANLKLTPEQRLERMVAAANFLESVRGAARRRTPR